MVSEYPVGGPSCVHCDMTTKARAKGGRGINQRISVNSYHKPVKGKAASPGNRVQG